MTTRGFTVTHVQDAAFERGLRSFFEYRDLGIKQATDGRVVAHVIRAAAGTSFSGQPHLHKTSFQLVYVLKGWICILKPSRPLLKSLPPKENNSTFSLSLR